MNQPGDQESQNKEQLPSTDDQKSKELVVKYKLCDLKVYSSDEWMAGATKKYRKVYDRYETTYMRLEFSFYNKLFDEADWDATIRMKCYFVNGSQKNELSNFEEKRNILKEENIVFARHSWGNTTIGSYWMKGNYVWEAFIDEVKVGETTFYVEDVGTAQPGENLYFDIESLRLFEGDSKGSATEQKNYLKSFNRDETRYIWGEFKFRNKTTKDYFAEIIFQFNDIDGQVKGTHNFLLFVKPNTVGEIYTSYASWGNEIAGSWKSETYTLEVLFMDHLIATVPILVGDTHIPGDVSIITDVESRIELAGNISPGIPQTTADEVLNESLAELESLTGLDNIKKEVQEMVRLVRYYQETGKDVLNKFSLHTVFIGNPGTGKTTVARILSKVYQGLGILSKGHLVEVDREGLVAGYIGQTAIKTGAKIAEAMGGVLFIDEAYSLAQEKGSPYDFGSESIQVLLKRMEDQRGQFGVIVAGYTQNMRGFINSNPGLRSRFDKYFTFEDYTPEQMMIIALTMYRKEEVMPDQKAGAHLVAYFTFMFDRRDDHFGNARLVRQVVSESVKNQNLRLADIPKAERTSELMATVIFADVAEFELQESEFTKRKLGFHFGPDAGG